jgi:hypothetical protein
MRDETAEVSGPDSSFIPHPSSLASVPAYRDEGCGRPRLPRALITFRCQADDRSVRVGATAWFPFRPCRSQARLANPDRPRATALPSPTSHPGRSDEPGRCSTENLLDALSTWREPDSVRRIVRQPIGTITSRNSHAGNGQCHSYLTPFPFLTFPFSSGALAIST